MFDIATAAISIGLHFGSVHTNKEPWQNNNNAGIYITVDQFAAGIYKNTLGNTSVYGAYDVVPADIKFGPLKPSLYVGYVTGYQPTRITFTNAAGKRVTETHDGMALFLSPSVKFPLYRNASGRVSILGKAIHFSAEWRF